MLLNNNHTACLGCAQIVAARTVIETLGANTIVVNATGCLEVTTTTYPNSAWQVPWIHSTFANAVPVATGIKAAFDYQRSQDKKKKKQPLILVQGGDGATFDIGFGALTASWARGDDLFYVCYDNEGYANTGMQASLATPSQVKTPTTASSDKVTPKRDMIAIALAHQVPYVAQANIAFIEDLKNKINQAKNIKGPKYIQVLVPCLPGWKIGPADQIKVAKLATETGLYPLLEYVEGRLTKIHSLPTPTPKIEEYIELQGRYQHLRKNRSAVKTLQAVADDNIRKYNLLAE